MLFFPDFAPDRSRNALDATSVALNVLPIADGWGPMPSLTEVSEALPSACRGAISVRSIAGAWKSYAGTSAKLFYLDTTDYSWDDYTRLAGGDYTLASTDRWSFCPFGATLIATQIADVVQSIDIDSGTAFAALAGSPPQAKYAAAVSEFLVLGHLANLPNYVRWSAFGDITSWTRGLGGAGQKEFPTGGEVQGIFPFENGAFVFARTAIHAMLLRPDGFDFTTVNSARGSISPYCVVPISANRFFYLAEDGFYIFDGVQDTPVGFERVDRWFLGGDSEDLVSEVDRTNLGDTRGFLDPFRKVVWVHYPKQDGTYGLLGYNYQIMGRDGRPGRWFRADLTVEEIVVLASAGVTIGGLADLFGTIGDVDVPFGSRLLTGGKPIIGAFTSDHKLAYFSGGNLAATLETPGIQVSPGYRSGAWEIELVGIFDEDAATIQIGTRDSRNSDITWSDEYSVETGAGGRFMTGGEDGMFHRARVNMAADGEWSSLTGIDTENSRFVRTGKV